MAARTEWAAPLLLALCAGCATHDERPTLREISQCEPPEGIPSRADWCQWPREVRAFADRYDSCEHFIGEEPYDEERRLFLERAIDESCEGNDSRLRKLRSAYSADAEMTRVLSQFDFNSYSKRP